MKIAPQNLIFHQSLNFTCQGWRLSDKPLKVRGMFITFEGIEGSGKTTQIKLLAESFENKGEKVVLTREPGGTDIGDKIRAILLDPANCRMTELTELFLYAAARNQHINEVIRPAIDEGRIVLCDRYADATEAYQGAARKIDSKIIEEIRLIATDGLKPDLTILLDLSAEEGLLRARSRNERHSLEAKEGRFEAEESLFHERVREGYLAIARKEPGRVKVVNASRHNSLIHQEILAIVQSLRDSKSCGLI